MQASRPQNRARTPATWRRPRGLAVLAQVPPDPGQTDLLCWRMVDAALEIWTAVGYYVRRMLQWGAFFLTLALTRHSPNATKLERSWWGPPIRLNNLSSLALQERAHPLLRMVAPFSCHDVEQGDGSDGQPRATPQNRLLFFARSHRSYYTCRHRGLLLGPAAASCLHSSQMARPLRAAAGPQPRTWTVDVGSSSIATSFAPSVHLPLPLLPLSLQCPRSAWRALSSNLRAGLSSCTRPVVCAVCVCNPMPRQVGR